MIRPVLLTAALTLLLGSTAMAGRVFISGDDTRFSAGREVNRVTAKQEGLREFAVTDRAARLRVGRDCFRTSAHSARCYDPRDSVWFSAGLGGGADSLKLTMRRGFARVYAGPGRDRMRADGRAKIEFFGGDGHDSISIDPAIRGDILDGGDGKDRITGGNHMDEVRGGDGDDVLDGRGGRDNDVKGGAGDDVLSATSGGGLIRGGSGNDRLTGGDRSTLIEGGAGDDFIDAAASRGDDLIHCGEGTDTVRMGPNDEFADPDETGVQGASDVGCENVTQLP